MAEKGLEVQEERIQISK